MVKHKCAECGYLAVRYLDTQQLLCPTQYHRENGEPPDEKNSRLSKVMFCSRMAFDLPKEAADGKKSRVEVIRDSRECGRFTQWQPLLITPKEHLDMDFLERMDARTRAMNRNNLLLSVLLVLVSVAAAVAAWWAALHPTVIPIPQPTPTVSVQPPATSLMIPAPTAPAVTVPPPAPPPKPPPVTKQ